MTQISLSLKSSLVLWPKWILHPPERPLHSVLTHPCSQVCVSVVVRAGKETLWQADWFRNFKKENWLLRIQFTTSKLVIFASRSWLGWERLTGEHMSLLPFSAFQQINQRMRHLPHPVLSHPCTCSWILRAGETSAFLSLLSRRWVGGGGARTGEQFLPLPIWGKTDNCVCCTSAIRKSAWKWKVAALLNLKECDYIWKKKEARTIQII